VKRLRLYLKFISILLLNSTVSAVWEALSGCLENRWMVALQVYGQYYFYRTELQKA